MYSTTECWWCVCRRRNVLHDGVWYCAHFWRRRDVVHDGVLVLRTLRPLMRCRTYFEGVSVVQTKLIQVRLWHVLWIVNLVHAML